VMTGSRRDTSQFRELLYSEHSAILNPNVTLKSRGKMNLAKDKLFARL
jgi:hypothetical protein